MGVFILVCLGILIQTSFIIAERKKKFVLAAILKGTASVVFVIIGCIGCYLATDRTFANLVLAGLTLGALGDILLALRFVFKEKGQLIFLSGVVAFLAGHIMYILALADISKDLLYCILAGVVLAVILLIIIFAVLKDLKPAFKVFGIIYIGAVSIMAAIAVGNDILLPYSLINIGFALGAVLFLISDIVMILNSFGKKERFALRITNLGLYYIGQIIIAINLLNA